MLQMNSVFSANKTKISSNFLLSQNRYLNTDSAMDLKSSQAKLKEMIEENSKFVGNLRQQHI
jgi:hypothetical protein